MRTMLLLKHLFLAFSLVQGSANPGSTEIASQNPAALSQPAEISFSMAGTSISLNAATGATIKFKAENGQEVNAPHEDGREIPYLVLNRNGVPTPQFERTLHLSVDHLQIPPTGLYAGLEIETQHSDPDLGPKSSKKIRVWQEKRFIPYTPEPRPIDFPIVFPRVLENDGTNLRTPTDYYGYQLTLWDAQGNILGTLEQKYAFLLESQWRVPLPGVLEAAPGAAPQELVVYFCDMIPFQSQPRDPETRIPRLDVERYIQTEIIPAMVDAFITQTNVWGLPWYEEWINFRSEEAPKTLSVALNEYGTWFHGAAPSLGHAMISIRVDGSFPEYDNITDGIMSVFHHELFHNQQRNISLHFGATGNISGKDRAWEIFSEGTAVLASLVGQPAIQMTSSRMPRSYLKRANAFIGSQGIFDGALNLSYTEVPYHTALYWRFLYEQCGGIQNGVEDPAAGMQIIRHTLETLYSGKIVDITASTSTVEMLPYVLDVAFYKTPNCPFHSYKESLVHFTRAIYLLTAPNGECSNADPTSHCRFFDPNSLYSIPDEEEYTITNAGSSSIDGTIRSSFGLDLIKLSPVQALHGKSLRLLFRSSADQQYTYNIELWSRQGSQANPVWLLVSTETRPGGLMEIDTLSLEQVQSLELVITRMDTHEDESQPGRYIIQMIVE